MRHHSPAVRPVGLWLALLIAALTAHSLFPIDETRYVSVAWEMWHRKQFLLPFLNGAAYSQKPPLLFWLIHAGWSLVGVSELWARLVSPLAGLAMLGLTWRIARVLWPECPQAARLAPLIVLGSLLWAVYNDLVLFDMLLGAWALLGILGILIVRRGDSRGWLVLGVAIGGGLLTKGPVILLHLLPAALLAPWWFRGARETRWSRWYLGVLLAVTIGLGIALAWALPAAHRGGPEYARAIFLGQTAQRVVHSFAHPRPTWWYLPFLPAILFPWSIWPPAWRALASLRGGPSDAGVRLCLAWLASGFALFSLISAKQIHYLLPLFPPFGLLLARALATVPAGHRRRHQVAAALILFGAGAAIVAMTPTRFSSNDPFPTWAAGISWTAGLPLILASAVLMTRPGDLLDSRVARLAAAAVLLAIVLNAGVARVAAPSYDVRPVGAVLRTLEREGAVIAHVGEYEGQYHFAGRLTRPFEIIGAGTVPIWLSRHPHGVVIWEQANSLSVEAAKPFRVMYSHPYRGNGVVSVIQP